jgi:hypothetical protein
MSVRHPCSAAHLAAVPRCPAPPGSFRAHASSSGSGDCVCVRACASSVRPDELGFPFLFLPPAAFCEGVGLGEPRLGSGARESLDAQQHTIRVMPRQRTRRAERTGMHRMQIPSASNFLPPRRTPNPCRRRIRAQCPPAPRLPARRRAAHSGGRGRLPPPRSTQLRLRPAPSASQRPTLAAAAHLLQSTAAAPGPPFVLCQPRRVPPLPLLTCLIGRSSLRSRARGAAAGGGGQASGEPPPSSQVRRVASW